MVRVHRQHSHCSKKCRPCAFEILPVDANEVGLPERFHGRERMRHVETALDLRRAELCQGIGYPGFSVPANGGMGVVATELVERSNRKRLAVVAPASTGVRRLRLDREVTAPAIGKNDFVPEISTGCTGG